VGLGAFGFALHNADMPRDRSQDFECPACRARYRVVRISVGPEKNEEEIFCRICEEPLKAREGGEVFKYFLVGRSKAARQMHDPQKP
jgi:predicted Zn finger-like uncharacterized protein